LFCSRDTLAALRVGQLLGRCAPLSADRETALGRFVVVVALLPDPAAVLLLLAATSARR
jgi:hypothetical protein